MSSWRVGDSAAEIWSPGQGPTMDGPFSDQWIHYHRNKSGQRTPQIHWYHIHSLAQDYSISIANTPEILQSWTNHWYICLYLCLNKNMDHPELRWTTQLSITGGPSGEPGFCFFCSTVEIPWSTAKPWKCPTSLSRNFGMCRFGVASFFCVVAENNSTWNNKS